MVSEVFNVDCLEYMKGLPDKFFELAIVDPPYGIGECASRNNTGNRSTAKWRNPKSKKYKPFDDSTPYKEHEYNELVRVSRNQIIWGANNFDFLPASTGWIVWDKCVSPAEHLSMCELAYSSFGIRCKKFTYLWAGFKREGNNKNKEARINHPTQKPVALYKWLLQNYAKKGDKIFDSHMGSQSSRLAAWDLGFDYYGCELDAEYFEQGNKRFEDFKKQQSLFTPEQAEVKTGLGYDLFASDNLKPNKHLK